MKALGALRRALGFRTIFNLVGPLTNPANARTHVVGVLAPSRVLLVGRTLAALCVKRAFVVHGTDGIDELTTTGESIVARIEQTDDEPGITRDRLYGDAEWNGRKLRVVDTGGILPEDKDFIPAEIFRAAPGRAG